MVQTVLQISEEKYGKELITKLKRLKSTFIENLIDQSILQISFSEMNIFPDMTDERNGNSMPF